MKCKLLFTHIVALLLVFTGYAQTTVSVGIGASGSTGGTNGTPIYRSSASSSFDYAQSVQLYTQADLNAAGIFSHCGRLTSGPDIQGWPWPGKRQD